MTLNELLEHRDGRPHKSLPELNLIFEEKLVNGIAIMLSLYVGKPQMTIQTGMKPFAKLFWIGFVPVAKFFTGTWNLTSLFRKQLRPWTSMLANCEDCFDVWTQRMK